MENNYYEIVESILNNPEFLKRKHYAHHDKITVYDHSLRVSLMSYRIAKKLRWKNLNDIAIGGLLHDFYYRDWQSFKEKRPFFKRHAFVHANEALNNSLKYFPELMNDRIINIIERHMFPINIKPPKYKEAWLVSTCDKIISFETLLHPTYFLKLFGYKM